MAPKAAGKLAGKIVGKLTIYLAIVGPVFNTINYTLERNTPEEARTVWIVPTIRLAQRQQPGLKNLIIRPDGLGELSIDKPVKDAAQAGLVKFKKDHCQATYESLDAPGDPGRWIAQYPGIQMNPDDPTLYEAFTLDVVDGRTKRIDIRSPMPKTKVGIHVGSTVAELRAAYGDQIEQIESGSVQDTWQIATPTGILYFAATSEYAAENADPEWGVVAGVIEYIRITTPDPPWDYAPSLGPGDAAGTCMP